MPPLQRYQRKAEVPFNAEAMILREFEDGVFLLYENT